MTPRFQFPPQVNQWLEADRLRACRVEITQTENQQIERTPPHDFY